MFSPEVGPDEISSGTIVSRLGGVGSYRLLWGRLDRGRVIPPNKVPDLMARLETSLMNPQRDPIDRR
jgi:hypothetical protein